MSPALLPLTSRSTVRLPLNLGERRERDDLGRPHTVDDLGKPFVDQAGISGLHPAFSGSRAPSKSSCRGPSWSSGTVVLMRIRMPRLPGREAVGGVHVDRARGGVGDSLGGASGEAAESRCRGTGAGGDPALGRQGGGDEAALSRPAAIRRTRRAGIASHVWLSCYRATASRPRNTSPPLCDRYRGRKIDERDERLTVARRRSRMARGPAEDRTGGLGDEEAG
jgi:hypothetical protein